MGYALYIRSINEDVLSYLEANPEVSADYLFGEPPGTSMGGGKEYTPPFEWPTEDTAQDDPEATDGIEVFGIALNLAFGTSPEPLNFPGPVKLGELHINEIYGIHASDVINVFSCIRTAEDVVAAMNSEPVYELKSSGNSLIWWSREQPLPLGDAEEIIEQYKDFFDEMADAINKKQAVIWYWA